MMVKAKPRVAYVLWRCHGVYWLFLFEAFNRTSVAIATVCYYMAPIGVMLLSPVVLKEKLKATQLVGVLMAFVGFAIVSGLFTPTSRAFFMAWPQPFSTCSW